MLMIGQYCARRLGFVLGVTHCLGKREREWSHKFQIMDKATRLQALQSHVSNNQWALWTGRTNFGHLRAAFEGNIDRSSNAFICRKRSERHSCAWFLGHRLRLGFVILLRLRFGGFRVGTLLALHFNSLCSMSVQSKYSVGMSLHYLCCLRSHA